MKKQQTKEPKQIGLFDIISDIFDKKKGIAISENGEMEPAFNQWMINEACSHHPDLIFLALEASKLKVSDQILHSFLINSIPPKRRFSKWFKTDKELKDRIANVSKYFGCANGEAEKTIQMLTEEQIQEIESVYQEETYKKINVPSSKPKQKRKSK